MQALTFQDALELVGELVIDSAWNEDQALALVYAFDCLCALLAEDMNKGDLMSWDLRLGDWRSVLSDVTECDAVICDPPYSLRTEKGFRTSASMEECGMGYDPIDEKWARAFVEHWHARCTGWIVGCGDHISIRPCRMLDATSSHQ